MMYSQSDKKGTLDALKNQNFLRYPTMVGRLLKNIFKIRSVGFITLW